MVERTGEPKTQATNTARLRLLDRHYLAREGDGEGPPGQRVIDLDLVLGAGLGQVDALRAVGVDPDQGAASGSLHAGAGASGVGAQGIDGETGSG